MTIRRLLYAINVQIVFHQRETFEDMSVECMISDDHTAVLSALTGLKLKKAYESISQ